MTPEERAVINAAIELRTKNIPGQDLRARIALDDAVWQLITRCPKCNAGGHVCPGCGTDVGHGDTACSICRDTPRDPEHPREVSASPRCSICGRLLGQLADPDSVDCGGDCAACMREEEGTALIWITRTWADVRAGDTVRMPGTDSTAKVVSAVHRAIEDGSNWHVHPAADEYRPNEMPANWSEVYVGLRPLDSEAPEDVPCTRYSMDPDGRIEIQTTQAEMDAIELLGGWPARVGIITE